ncbi:hypothetical protein GYA13_01685 [Candidatus Kuenenbacteria bacterium]|nr:hypothetical protein [Candidatus Kuenenbacteria bacterium]
MFIFLLPWQTRWIFRDYQIDGQVFEYGRLSLYGFDIILIVIMAILLYCRIVKREEREIRNQKLVIRN